MAEAAGAGDEAVPAVTFTESTFNNGRGQALHVVRYVPSAAAPRAVLLWHHGYGEHVGRYDRVFRRIAAQGIVVYAFDAHGHGKSPPQAAGDRAYIKDYRHLVDDVYTFVDDVVKKEPYAALPLYMGGQSMGGLVAALSVLRDQARWAGLILHSAAVDVEWTLALKIQAPIGGLMAAVAPRARVVPAVAPEHLSPDPAVVKAYVEDPLNTVGPVRARTGNELLKGFGDLGGKKGEIKVPLLVVHGDRDKVTSRPAAARLAEAAASTDKKFVEVPGGYHELLMGPEWQECTDRLAAWILERSPAAAAGTASPQPRM